MRRFELKKSVIIYGLILAAVLILYLALPAWAGDPTGANTGSAADIAAAQSGAPTLEELATAAGKLKIGLNFVWTLLAGFLVFFMQAGFALVETGFTRAKNAAHTMAMNLMVFLVGAVGFFVLGFGLMFGGLGAVANLGGTPSLVHELTAGGWGLLGLKGFFLNGDAYDVGVFALFLFQMVFMDTAVTIPTGAMAERVKFGAIVLGSFFIAMFLYPIFGNWVWGGGWLAQLGAKLGLGHGAVDFAGSGVVHSIGGAAGLAGALILGPRLGKYRDGKPAAIPGHDIPMAVLGTIILFFGWFGFNPGSTLSGGDLRIAVVAVNTMMAGAVGGLTSMLYTWWRQGKPDPSMMCNGVLAGLVAITAPCAFVNAPVACLIGAVAGVLVVWSVYFFDHVVKVDDPVGAISVHLVNGLWGLLAVGLFADGTYGAGWNGVGVDSYLGVAGQGVTGLFYGDPTQFVAQLINMVVVFIWGFGASYVFYKVLDRVMGIRVKPEAEDEGLDIPEIGALAYPDFMLTFSDAYSPEPAPAGKAAYAPQRQEIPVRN
ncbi:ammonium transporter [Moorella sp. Hama-1]|uniref:ammonium transporter n=1 Tax=Moorella sp. Hama-1 TaxID=2138101 RepID=UPI000D657121|nr:ammonium transporter [Moorella sp. Hama-1]BCV21454.1 ammonium transporter [Moorella sp. Hama-1]